MFMKNTKTKCLSPSGEWCPRPDITRRLTSISRLQWTRCTNRVCTLGDFNMPWHFNTLNFFVWHGVELPMKNDEIQLIYNYKNIIFQRQNVNILCMISTNLRVKICLYSIISVCAHSKCSRLVKVPKVPNYI